MIDLELEQNVRDNVADRVIDAIRHLAAFTATESLSDISKARTAITRIARHEICGELGKFPSGQCGYGCIEVAMPLWNVTLYVQRALTIDKAEK